MNLQLKPLVAALAFVASGAAIAAGFTPPEAPKVIDRMELTRNHNGRFGEPNDWMNRITLSGELNIDGRYSDSTVSQIDDSHNLKKKFSLYGDRKSSNIGLADANLYVSARPNDWVTANVDIIAEDNHSSNITLEQVAGSSDHNKNFDTQIDEAYVTFGNFRESPLYVLAGREFVPYGYYNRHPITVPFTQLLTQTNATTLQLGFVDTSGFNGSVFAFRTEKLAGTSAHTDSLGGTVVGGTTQYNTVVSSQRHRVENGGFQLGYKYDQADMGLIADVSWLGNLAAVDYVSNNLTSYTESVPGYSVDVMAHYQALDGQVQYTAATDDFAVTDVCYKCNSLVPGVVGQGAKPRAWLFGIGYNFDMAAHKSRFGVNYQKSREAVDLGQAGLPRRRIQADWTVNLYKNTDVTFEYVHDKDYGKTVGGTGEKAATGIVCLSTRFA